MSEWALPAALRCPCGGETSVVNTRGRESRDVIYRQRLCQKCGEKFPTYETRITLEQLERAREQLNDAMKRFEHLLKAALHG